MKHIRIKIATILLVVSLLFVIKAEANKYIDSLVLLPNQPSSGQSFSVVCYASFGDSYCKLDSFTIDTSNNIITINVHHNIGGMTSPCISVDTIQIGKLPAGNYLLRYNLRTTYGPQFFDMDSISFYISSNDGLQVKTQINADALIYPNPTNNKLEIELATPQIEELQLMISDLVGHVYLQTYLSKAKNTINLEELPDGIYLVVLSSAIGESKYSKIIIAHNL